MKQCQIIFLSEVTQLSSWLCLFQKLLVSKFLWVPVDCYRVQHTPCCCIWWWPCLVGNWVSILPHKWTLKRVFLLYLIKNHQFAFFSVANVLKQLYFKILILTKKETKSHLPCVFTLPWDQYVESDSSQEKVSVFPWPDPQPDSCMVWTCSMTIWEEQETHPALLCL